MVLVHEYFSGGGAPGGVEPHEAAELLEQGRAMRDAMADDLRALPAVEAMICTSPRDFDARLAAADAVWSVAPESAGILAAICAAVPAGKWLGCTADAIRIGGSKSATRECLGAAGLPVPAGASPGASGRFVVKPDDGAGATDTRVFDSLAAARAAASAGMAIEAFVEGEALSATLLCAHGRAEMLSVNRQRIDIDAQGHVAYRGVEIAIEPVSGARGRVLQPLLQRLAGALPGLFGIVGVDLVWHRSSGPVIVEVNPRLTSAYVGLSAKLGRNLAGELLALRR